MKARVKKIAYVSGTRADFGLMKPVLAAVAKHRKLSLRLYATGMHLMPGFGGTLQEVKKFFPKVKVFRAAVKNDTPAAMAEFFARVSMLASKEFSRARPDVVLVLGDRPEMLAVASVCLYLGIPVTQLHGGERTSTVDELARHAITKLASLHLPAAKDAARRIQKMGEEPQRIRVVGAPGLDAILHARLPSRRRLFKELGIKDELKKFILLTLHPVSEDIQNAARQMRSVLAAAVSFHLPVIAIYPNADAGGRKMVSVLKQYANKSGVYIFPSVPHEDFLALEREAAVWVGNSSAAMIESASFGTPVVNVGPRQQKRLRAGNVIDAPYDSAQIKAVIRRALRQGRQRIQNPWGDGKTGPRVAKILAELKIDQKLLSKQITY